MWKSRSQIAVCVDLMCITSTLDGNYATCFILNKREQKHSPLNSSRYPSHYPVVVGHEITGVVTRVGKNVTKVKVGDRAGLGPIAYACGDCEPCNTGISNLCDYGYVGTYNDYYPRYIFFLNTYIKLESSLINQ